MKCQWPEFNFRRNGSFKEVITPPVFYDHKIKFPWLTLQKSFTAFHTRSLYALKRAALIWPQTQARNPGNPVSNKEEWQTCISKFTSHGNDGGKQPPLRNQISGRKLGQQKDPLMVTEVPCQILTQFCFEIWGKMKLKVREVTLLLLEQELITVT